MHFFQNQSMTNKRINKFALKGLFKTLILCYSIGEANGVLNRRITRSASAGANGGNIPAYVSFNIWWSYIAQEKLSAYMYSNRKVCLIGKLCIRFLNDYE